MSKWPKTPPDLISSQKIISNDFMKHWHEVLANSSRYGMIEKFNHGYSIKTAPREFLTAIKEMHRLCNKKKGYFSIEVKGSTFN